MLKLYRENIWEFYRNQYRKHLRNTWEIYHKHNTRYEQIYIYIYTKRPPSAAVLWICGDISYYVYDIFLMYFFDGLQWKIRNKRRNLCKRMEVYRRHFNSDKDLVELKSKIEYLEVTVDFIKRCMDNITWRHQTIRNTIDWRKFMAGQ